MDEVKCSRCQRGEHCPENEEIMARQSSYEQLDKQGKPLTINGEASRNGSVPVGKFSFDDTPYINIFAGDEIEAHSRDGNFTLVIKLIDNNPPKNENLPPLKFPFWPWMRDE